MQGMTSDTTTDTTTQAGGPTASRPVVKEVVDRFKQSWDYAKDNHHNRWTRNWKLYNNKRSNVGYEGITNTFVPMSFSTVETVVAALCAGRPSIDFEPTDMWRYVLAYYESGKKPDLKALNSQFDYYWSADNWDLKTIKSVRATAIFGIAGEWYYWDFDKPRIINVNARDLILDPSMTDPMQLLNDPNNTYAGRRYITTLDALKEEQVVDPDTGKFKPRYRNLRYVKPVGSMSEKTDKQLKDDINTGSLLGDDTIEVVEIWDGKRIRSVANRKWLIEDRDNELGFIPLGLFRIIADESTVYGKALIDPIADPQELLNDITNQSVDAVTDVLNPQYELDPQYVDHIEKIENAPGTIYPFRPGSLQMIQKNAVTNSQAFAERQNIKNEIREASGADQIVQGVAQSQNATATEIQAQLVQAGQRFELFVLMLEKEAFYMRAKIVFRLMKKYVTDVQLVPTMTMDGPKFYPFNPEHYSDDYEPKISLETRVKSAQVREQQRANQAFQIMIADPTNDLWEAKKILYPKMFDLSDEELDRIIGSEKPAPAGPPSMASGQALPPGDMSTAVPADPVPLNQYAPSLGLMP